MERTYTCLYIIYYTRLTSGGRFECLAVCICLYKYKTLNWITNILTIYLSFFKVGLKSRWRRTAEAVSRSRCVGSAATKPRASITACHPATAVEASLSGVFDGIKPLHKNAHLLYSLRLRDNSGKRFIWNWAEISTYLNYNRLFVFFCFC